jgi:hypothetical protein
MYRAPTNSANAIILRLATSAEGERGVIVSGKNGYLNCPLCMKHETLFMLLKSERLFQAGVLLRAYHIYFAFRGKNAAGDVIC